jgi:hypothetical protein
MWGKRLAYDYNGIATTALNMLPQTAKREALNI